MEKKKEDAIRKERRKRAGVRTGKGGIREKMNKKKEKSKLKWRRKT